MKYVKMLSLAAVAAMVVVAIAAAGTASASALCTATDTPDCEATHKYGQGTVLDFSAKSGGSMKNTSGVNTISTCAGSTIKATVGNAGSPSETVSGSIKEWTWSGCSQTTDTVANGSLEVHWIEGTHNGTVTGKGSEWTVQVFGVSCTYGTGSGTHLGTFTGGVVPVLQIETIITKTAGGFLCPSTTGWDAEYEVKEPHALFVTTG